MNISFSFGRTRNKKNKHKKDNKKRDKWPGYDGRGNKIGITFNEPFHMEGTTVNGTVCFFVQNTINIHRLDMKAQGYETTEWTEKHTETEWVDKPDGTREAINHEEIRDYEGDRDIFKQKWVLEVPGTLGPGAYSFPFSFTLPHDSPGSFEEKTNNPDGSIYLKYKAKIKYKVKAKVQGADLRAKEKFVVRQNIDENDLEQCHDSRNGCVCAACCFYMGQVSMNCTLNKAAFKPGEEGLVILDANNKSFCSVSNFSVKLMRTLKLFDEGPQRGMFVQEHVMSCHEYEGMSLCAAVNNLEMGLEVPLDTLPTAQGRHVRCEYHVDVESNVPCAFDVEMHVPVSIYVTPHVNLQATWIVQALPQVPWPAIPPGYGIAPPPPQSQPAGPAPLVMTMPGGQPNNGQSQIQSFPNTSAPAPHAMPPSGAGGQPHIGSFPSAAPGSPPGGHYPSEGSPPGSPPTGYSGGGPPQGSYPPGGPPQGSYPPGGPPQGSYPPGGPPQGSYPPGGPPQGSYPPGGPPQGSYPPGGPPQGSYPPDGQPEEGRQPGVNPGEIELQMQ